MRGDERQTREAERLAAQDCGGHGRSDRSVGGRRRIGAWQERGGIGRRRIGWEEEEDSGMDTNKPRYASCMACWLVGAYISVLYGSGWEEEEDSGMAAAWQEHRMVAY